MAVKTVQPVTPPKALTQPKGMSWGDFVKMASKVAKQEGYPVSVLLGQAALETGRKVSNAPGNNFFGMKGNGTAGSQNLRTWEDYGNGPQTINDNFAAYQNPEDSIKAYIDLIKKNYPSAMALKDDPAAMISEIKRLGYATDPAYVSKVMSTPEFKGSALPDSTDNIPSVMQQPQVGQNLADASVMQPTQPIPPMVQPQQQPQIPAAMQQQNKPQPQDQQPQQTQDQFGSVAPYQPPAEGVDMNLLQGFQPGPYNPYDPKQRNRRPVPGAMAQNGSKVPTPNALYATKLFGMS